MMRDTWAALEEEHRRAIENLQEAIRELPPDDFFQRARLRCDISREMASYTASTRQIMAKTRAAVREMSNAAQLLMIHATLEKEEQMRLFKTGQTMVEYALVIAAVGLVAYGAFHLLGNGITTLASGVDSMLSAA